MACCILAKKSCSSHLFGGGPKLGCSDSVRDGIIESHNFFCLVSYLGKISHSNSANQELSNDILVVVVRRRKVALHTSSHLTPIEAWRRDVSTTLQGRRVSSEVPWDTCMRVLAVGKIWRPCDLRSRSYKRLYTHVHTHTHAHKAIIIIV